MHSSKLYSLPVITGLIILSAIPIGAAQSGREIDGKRAENVIDSISSLLNQYYVFPDVAKKIAVQLKEEYAQGRFNNLKTEEEFAEKVNLEMKSIAHDLHLRFSLAGGSISTGTNRRKALNYNYQIVNDIREFGFFRTGKMNNGIGYLEILGFPPLDSAKKSIDAAMDDLTDSKALIIDVRRNGGGVPVTIRYVCSYFFEKPTHINSIYWRYLDKTVDFITLEKVDGRKMVDVPIFVLTSSFTVSGGEEFAYNIQTQKRGVLIGEVTAGGANPSDVFSVENFRLSIPTGRAINPITKKNWEGIGVQPDVEIEAARALESAFETASFKIKVNAQSQPE